MLKTSFASKPRFIPFAYALFLSCLAIITGCGPDSTNKTSPDASVDADHDIDADSSAENFCEPETCDGLCRFQGFPEGGICRQDICFCSSTEGCIVGHTTLCYSGPSNAGGKGACLMGTSTCTDTNHEFPAWGPCEGDVHPIPEVCNEIDDDCDGLVDEGLSCLPPGTPCVEGDICVEGQHCVEFPSGRKICANPEPCSGPNSSGECSLHQACVEFPDSQWYCTDQPELPMYGCGWVWHYFSQYLPECSLWSAYHFDMSGRCNLETQDRCAPVAGGKYECQQAEKTELGHYTLPLTPPASVRVDFVTSAWGILHPEVLEYCVLAWGVHSADPWDLQQNSGPITIVPGQRRTFTHRDLLIDSELFDQFAVIDPVVLGNGRTAVAAWDVSAAPVRNTPIPYDYAPLGTNPESCTTQTGIIPAGSMTYEQLVEYVQTTEDVYSWESGDFNVALAFYAPYYRDRGEDYVGLVAELHCMAIDGIDHVMTGATGFYIHPGQ